VCARCCQRSQNDPKVPTADYYLELITFPNDGASVALDLDMEPEQTRVRGIVKGGECATLDAGARSVKR